MGCSKRGNHECHRAAFLAIGIHRSNQVFDWLLWGSLVVFVEMRVNRGDERGEVFSINMKAVDFSGRGPSENVNQIFMRRESVPNLFP